MASYDYDWEEELRGDELFIEGDDREEVNNQRCYKCGEFLTPDGVCPECDEEEEEEWGPGNLMDEEFTGGDEWDGFRHY